MILDITDSFKKLIEVAPEQEDHENANSNPNVQSELCYKQANNILLSINKINSFLVENKENYFSNAAYSYSAFTDQQRTEFDNEVKDYLDNCCNKINELQVVTEKVKFNNATEKNHFKQMVVCLYQSHKSTKKIFREFMEFNENRKRKLQAMIGNHTKPTLKKENKQKDMGETSLRRKVSRIDEELEKESQMIYMEKMSEQKKIEDTKKTLEKINKVLDEMSNKVLEQELLTSSFREIGEVGLFHIERGNKQLTSANEISRDTGKYWTYYFLALAFSLLILDYIKS